MPTYRRAFAAAAALTIGLALAAGLRSAVRDPGVTNANAARIALEMCSISAVLGSLAVVGALALPGSATDRLGLRRGRLPAPWVAVMLVGTLGLSHAINALLPLTGLVRRSALTGTMELLHGARGWPLAVALLGISIGPGVSEELLCRGLVQRSAVVGLGPRGAVVLGALVFGAIHLDLVYAAAAAVIGLYLGIVAHWAQSTRPSMLCHSANNAAAVLGASGLVAWSPPLVASAAMGLALAAACLWWTGRHLPRGDRDFRPPPGRPLQGGRHPVDG